MKRTRAINRKAQSEIDWNEERNELVDELDRNEKRLLGGADDQGPLVAFHFVQRCPTFVPNQDLNMWSEYSV